MKILHILSQMPDFTGSGTGVEKEECLALAGRFGKQVKVHGPLSHQDLAVLMRQSHIFILPSFFEGLPLVLMEALASGCRIITTSLPGSREVLGESGNSMVKMVALPELETIDTPFEKDRQYLETILAKSIEQVVNTVMKHHQPDMKTAQKLTEKYTWEKVFSRIENV
ncbi:MAG: glycosyltransferase family 4 protein [Desulfobacteraceae bacterium]|nr:glycosyltransferase family 4 protein [Desulfobacteraceae bacterium]